MGTENNVHEAKDPPEIMPSDGAVTATHAARMEGDETEADDFGLPRKTATPARFSNPADSEDEDGGDTFHDAEDVNSPPLPDDTGKEGQSLPQNGQEYKPRLGVEKSSAVVLQPHSHEELSSSQPQTDGQGPEPMTHSHNLPTSITEAPGSPTQPVQGPTDITTENPPSPDEGRVSTSAITDRQDATSPTSPTSPKIQRKRQISAPAVSEWSHQRLAPKTEESESEEEESWQAMPALGEYDIYDEQNRLVARGAKAVDEEQAAYGGLGGAAKGYTRVQLDEDAQSATSMDDDTNYLFKDGQKNALDEDEEQRDATAQLEATKDLLTEGQRIAYVGIARLVIYNMVRELENVNTTKTTTKLTKRAFIGAFESMEKWGQKMMVRLYGHMEINSAEQLMIEQLAEHGVQPTDLVPPLMHNSRVKNPMADEPEQQRPSSPLASSKSTEAVKDEPTQDLRTTSEPGNPPPYEAAEGSAALESKTYSEPEALPAYEIQGGEQVPQAQSLEEMPHTAQIDIDLRWTVLCDLFLMLISDSVYDARSRVLLERVASSLQISWVQICRFEKRVTDALEMQEEEAKENWNEADHMEKRRKMGLRRKYMYMGLATVGGGLVIGLSAGLLAPVIGAGLAAGFTTIGVTGTAGFLGGVGGAALVTSAATAAGGTVAVRAAHRRTGAVKTFEYRPLHNNKRVNLILTVSGWMNGKVDDVRLPYSTVDPIMGDIYSLLWEPEMLQSMGDTINILATEALTQTVQQVLGMTILTALMAAIQLPVVLTKLSYLIDNPWSVSLDRANSAGQILADSLIDRHLGNRPITLLGFSLGSRLIFSCLVELAARGAHGLVQNVYLFGSPIVASREEYLRARSMVSGRFVNGYASNDWILGYLFRATSGGIMRVAGLAPVEDIPGLENLDVTPLVNGHMAYRAAMPRLLRQVGWEVESDEFTEIEDPDPENHDKRQRELIREIDNARKEAEVKPKSRFAFFKRGKATEKKGWETYDASEKNSHSRSSSEHVSGFGPGDNGILFDIDAITKELASEMIEVRELHSTLPPMQILTARNGMHERSLSAELTMNGERSMEAALAQQGFDPEEIAKLKLPPRPDEIHDDHNHPSTNGKTVNLEPTMSFEPDIAFALPKELESTLPPLKLSPSLPHTSSGNSTPSLGTIPRPELKSHATTPNFLSARDVNGSGATAVPTSSFPGLNMERNAWADEEEDFGQEKEVQMTFE